MINNGIRQDSDKNKGLPIVLHCIKVGVDKKAKIKRLFLILFDKNNTRKGRLII